MKINSSVKFKPGNYVITPFAESEKPVVLIQGNNIVVDFNNLVLRGSTEITRPDKFSGVAVLIKNSKKVTIRNLKVRGYKIALIAVNVEGLIIENSNMSYNYRPQLNSSQEKEDISDWMSYHKNEKDEWLRYGAAIYLSNCNQATIRNCKVTGGQNALMMTRCNDGMIYNNDFSFNSGIGLGMYRSSGNKVMHNRINFNVRGYSHGVYNRGQDSAGILIYEQSNNNLFYQNSVTHGGDGFFLWAGQSTMDNGQGGCNDNKLLQNDFSYAPTNGIEVTFSRNLIDGNRIFECDHGIWGGYSYQTIIRNNQFRNNRIAIAIEHGQDNIISNNLFAGDKEAIRLWARKEQPSDWGYAIYRDTRSRDYVITTNSFNKHSLVLNLNRTQGIKFYDNTFSGSGKILKTDSTVVALDTLPPAINELVSKPDTMIELPLITKALNAFEGAGKYAGRKNIMMTEWGPYDFRSPVIWNNNPTDSSEWMKFDLLAPGGKWRIINVKNVDSLSALSGVFPAEIKAKKTSGSTTDIEINLEYTGPAIITAYGEIVPANRPYRFSFRKFFQPIDWEVLFFSMDTSVHNPIKTGELFSPLEKKAPVKTEKVKKLDYAWWGGIKAGDQVYPQFMTSASGQAEVPAGLYELSVTWDDAVRIFLDEKLVIDEWVPSRYNFDESPNKKIQVKLNGRHNFRVEHIELGGFACLSLKLKLIGQGKP
jgi:parallel beta-helix repeat protein